MATTFARVALDRSRRLPGDTGEDAGRTPWRVLLAQDEDEEDELDDAEGDGGEDGDDEDDGDEDDGEDGRDRPGWSD